MKKKFTRKEIIRRVPGLNAGNFAYRAFQAGVIPVERQIWSKGLRLWYSPDAVDKLRRVMARTKREAAA